MTSRIEALFQSPDLSDWMARRYDGIPKDEPLCECARPLPDRAYGRNQRSCRKCGLIIPLRTMR